MALAEVDVATRWSIDSLDRADDAAGAPPPADRLDGAVVVANELFDNVPFRWMRRGADGWLEVWLQNGSPAWGPVDDDTVERLERVDSIRGLPVDAEFPWLGAAADLLAHVLASRPALVVAFDYGAPTTAELAERGGWLRTYAGHRRGDDPFVAPGRLDITTDVAWDQLPPATSLRTQAEALRSWGIDDLVAEGRTRWTEAAARPDLTAMRMRSRISEAVALLDPEGLGGFWCAEWHP